MNVFVWFAAAGLLAAPVVGLAFELKLAPIARFASESAAQQHCTPDPVVWADEATGTFYSKRDADYGLTAAGAFACLSETQAADYWDRNPFSTLKDRGRSFPINPDLICPLCS